MSEVAAAPVLGALALALGSIPSGLIFARLFTGKDVRQSGSGNIGAANVSRVAGYRVAALVLIADIVKGVVPVVLARWAGLDWWGVSAVAVAAVVGHDFSIFLKLRGGKGVATTLGTMLVLAPLATLIAGAIWLLVVAMTRYSSLGSLLCLCVLPILAWLVGSPTPVVLAAVVLALLAVFKHRENMARLVSGEERPVGGGKTRDG